MRAYVEQQAIAEPIEAEQAANWLRLDADVTAIDDDLVQRLVTAAREYCEHYCDRAFAAQTWRVEMDSFTETVLPGGQVGAVKSFEYITADGATETVPAETYKLSRDGRLRLNPGKSWPAHTGSPDTVQIVYEVGTDEVGQDVVQAMRMLLSHYYEERRGVAVGKSLNEMPLGVESLLHRHKMMIL